MRVIDKSAHMVLSTGNENSPQKEYSYDISEH
jgi:hypothetical protein